MKLAIPKNNPSSQSVFDIDHPDLPDSLFSSSDKVKHLFRTMTFLSQEVSGTLGPILEQFQKNCAQIFKNNPEAASLFFGRGSVIKPSSYVCELCGATFSKACSLGGHVSRKHKMQPPSNQSDLKLQENNNIDPPSFVLTEKRLNEVRPQQMLEGITPRHKKIKKFRTLGSPSEGRLSFLYPTSGYSTRVVKPVSIMRLREDRQRRDRTKSRMSSEEKEQAATHSSEQSYKPDVRSSHGYEATKRPIRRSARPKKNALKFSSTL